jgi:hypothetical protein
VDLLDGRVGGEEQPAAGRIDDGCVIAQSRVGEGIPQKAYNVAFPDAPASLLIFWI